MRSRTALVTKLLNSDLPAPQSPWSWQGSCHPAGPKCPPPFPLGLQLKCHLGLTEQLQVSHSRPSAEPCSPTPHKPLTRNRPCLTFCTSVPLLHPAAPRSAATLSSGQRSEPAPWGCQALWASGLSNPTVQTHNSTSSSPPGPTPTQVFPGIPILGGHPFCSWEN
jgi:hypothetical protein